MPQYSSTTANQLWGFTHYLESGGYDVKRLIKDAQLPILLLSQPHLKVSTRLVYHFIDLSASTHHSADFGWQVGEFIGWEGLAEICQEAAKETTVELALKRLCQLTTVGASHADFFLKYHEQAYYLCHVGGVSEDSPGYYHVETYLVNVLKDFIQCISGDHSYSPPSIKLRSSKPPSAEPENIQFQQEYTAIEIPNSLIKTSCYADNLVLKNNKLIKETDATPFPDLSDLPTYIDYPQLETLSSILVTYLLEDIPSIDFIADIGGSSTRSLQRKLNEQGISYQKLVQSLRTDIAKRLLANKHYSVYDAAALLQYKHHTHFIRAFKKSTKSTPKQFQLHSQKSSSPLR